MKYLSLLILLFTLATSACNNPSSIVKNTPDGFEVFATDTLLFEQNEFVINTLKYIEEDSLSESNTELIRPLIILKRQPDSSYKMVARNDSAVLCSQCGGIFGDPWEGLEILNDGFRVNHFGGSSQKWGRKTSFIYQASSDKWILKSDISFSIDPFDSENDYSERDLVESYNDKSLLFEDFNINDF